MLERKLKVLWPILILLFAIVFVICTSAAQAALVVLIAPLWITYLVVRAIFAPDITDKKINDSLPPIPSVRGKTAFLTTLYDKTIQMHIETDSGMYQLISIFVGASVLILGWVLASSKPDAITRDSIMTVGSLAVVLVGVATLLKHRLRYYNKVREIYLRRLEAVLLKGQLPKDQWGLHNFVKKFADPGDVSFHEVIDIYYFVNIFIWAIVYFRWNR